MPPPRHSLDARQQLEAAKSEAYKLLGLEMTNFCSHVFNIVRLKSLHNEQKEVNPSMKHWEAEASLNFNTLMMFRCTDCDHPCLHRPKSCQRRRTRA